MLRLEAGPGAAPYSAARTGPPDLPLIPRLEVGRWTCPLFRGTNRSPDLPLIPQHEAKKGRVSFCISRLFSLALNRGAR